MDANEEYDTNDPADGWMPLVNSHSTIDDHQKTIDTVKGSLKDNQKGNAKR